MTKPEGPKTRHTLTPARPPKEDWRLLDQIRANVTAIMSSHKVTVQSLCRETGLPTDPIYKFLRGERDHLPVPVLPRIASHFGVPVDVLVGPTSEALRAGAAGARMAKLKALGKTAELAETMELLDMLKSLDPRARGGVRAQLEFFVGPRDQVQPSPEPAGDEASFDDPDPDRE